MFSLQIVSPIIRYCLPFSIVLAVLRPHHQAVQEYGDSLNTSSNNFFVLQLTKTPTRCLMIFQPFKLHLQRSDEE